MATKMISSSYDDAPKRTKNNLTKKTFLNVKINIFVLKFISNTRKSSQMPVSHNVASQHRCISHSFPRGPWGHSAPMCTTSAPDSSLLSHSPYKTPGSYRVVRWLWTRRNQPHRIHGHRIGRACSLGRLKLFN